MSKWIIYLIIGGALVAGYVYALKQYGESRYQAGLSSATTTQAQEGMTANDDARSIKEEADRLANSLDDADANDELRKLGIMRAAE